MGCCCWHFPGDERWLSDAVIEARSVMHARAGLIHRGNMNALPSPRLSRESYNMVLKS